DRLDKIALRHIHVSMDSLDKQTYAAIRLKGDLQKVLDAMEAFVAFRNRRRDAGRGFALFASMCVQKRNWREVPAFIEWCAAREIGPIFQTVIGQTELSLASLPVSERREVLAWLQPILDSDRAYAVMPVVTELQATLEGAR